MVTNPLGGVNGKTTWHEEPEQYIVHLQQANITLMEIIQKLIEQQAVEIKSVVSGIRGPDTFFVDTIKCKTIGEKNDH